jgi:citrate synthase
MDRLTTRGLAGIEADDTALSHVEGTRGRLAYRGYPIEELTSLPFEAVLWLLLEGELPTESELEAFSGWLIEVGELTAADRALIDAAKVPRHASMTLVQGLLPLLDTTGPDAPLPGFGDHAGLRLAARLAPLVARILGDGSPPGPGTHWERFLEAATGDRRHSEAFRVLQILQLDHGFNAGTFTARVVASTRASTPAALVAAAGALSGVLHGGADQAALADAREVGRPERAAAFVDHCLESGRRVMGMGHREYRVVDPRARIIRTLARDLAEGTDLENLQATLEAMETRFSERMAEKGKALHANLEFYKSVVCLACGLPEQGFTATFAASRVFGWLAHVDEARRMGTIIRPAARWTGVPMQPIPG